ncbi:hypothetical protein NDK25_24320 [Niallia taxi]|nr:hypothetical protein [Niallia taxi]MDE5055347.1 hypothetical protein [Niallia taxi]
MFNLFKKQVYENNHLTSKQKWKAKQKISYLIKFIRNKQIDEVHYLVKEEMSKRRFNEELMERRIGEYTNSKNKMIDDLHYLERLLRVDGLKEEDLPLLNYYLFHWRFSLPFILFL